MFVIVSPEILVHFRHLLTNIQINNLVMAIRNKEPSRITPGITSIDILVDMDSPICEARPIVSEKSHSSARARW